MTVNNFVVRHAFRVYGVSLMNDSGYVVVERSVKDSVVELSQAFVDIPVCVHYDCDFLSLCLLA